MAAHVETQWLISDWREGNLSSRDKLIQRILPELEQISAARLRNESKSSLSTNDLINEAMLRIMANEPEITDRAHLLALVSRLMRNVLVDQARARNAGKREHFKVELQPDQDAGPARDLHLLDSALIRLEAIEPGFAEIVEMRYFGGMTIGDIAEVTGWSEPTVKRRWQVAKAWLADALTKPLPDG
ncbi:ECF-type sigma factor [Pontixanthobacter aquaemixtae]|uniref:Sigma-70 family RNA polymerase sigma factor n=1 Tax=Pontixanthobacter aquaemixtae TaxID=1958940 RepID=A0A844ZYF1_9SPHN|nr:ECF-type sigma factor [Pontixanthobacter aquaemixtae]MXO91966.1 sigma-70 family RNA polymerase sigma factor [Pontixanthobacter aquaemixtae]